MQSIGEIPFTGRTAELSRLHDTYMRALHNELQVASIEGDPGVGKSTIVDQFLSELDDRGALTLKTYGASQYGGFTSVFSGLLRSFLSAASPRDTSTSNLFELGAASALSRLAPEIREIIPFEIPPAPELDPGQTHQVEQILDGLRLFILRLATRRPLILLFEDAHWFDIRTWEALSFFERTLIPYPVMMIVTLRISDLNDEQRKEYKTFSRNRQVERIRLDSLDEGDSRRVIERLFGAEIADNIATQVHTSTGGNPLFLHETLNTLVERQLLLFDRGDSRWKQTVDISDKLPAPESAAYIFDERISIFSEKERSLLKLASLLGFTFQAGWLKDLSQLPEDAFISFVNRALKANLLNSDFQGHLSFYHQLIQQRLEDSLPSTERRDLRRRMYEYFRERSRTHNSEGPFHRFLACDTYEHELVSAYGLEIVESNLAATSEAFASFATAQAVRYLETARLILQKLDSVNEAERLRLLFRIYLELATVALESGRFRDALKYNRANAMFIASHLKLAPEQRLRLLRGLAEGYYKAAAYSRSANCVTQAVTLAAGATSPEAIRELARMQFIAGLSLYNQGQYDRAMRETEQGLRMLSEHDALEPQLELTGLRTQGIILNRLGNHREAEEVFTRSLRLAERLGDRREIGRAHYYLGVVSQYLGEFLDAMESYRRSLAVCREADDLETMSKIYNNLGVHYSEAGDYHEARRHFERALELQEQIGAVYAALTTRINLAGALQTTESATEAALKETRKLFSECKALNAVNLIPAIYDSEVEIAMDAGWIEQASQSLKEMEEWLKTHESKYGLDHMRRLKARLEILRGDFNSGAPALESVISGYREKGESFRAAQTMTDGAIAACDAIKNSAHVTDEVAERIESWITGALDIYRNLQFTIRMRTLRENILKRDTEKGRFGKLVKRMQLESGAKIDDSRLRRLQVSCFGRLKVICPGRHDEVDEKAWPSKKARGLLAYLVEHTSPERPVSRDRICDALWSHLGPDTILSSFHVTLSHLRKTLTTESSREYQSVELIHHNDGNYNLAWDEYVWSDVKEFDTLYTRAHKYLRENKRHLAERDFEDARGLYQGPLLEDMYDSWLEELRDEYRRKYIDVSSRLAEIAYDKEEYERAIAFCQDVLLVDSTEEQTHRLLMLALYTTGQKAAAVRQFQACERALKKQLDIDPAPKTVELAEKIRTAEPDFSELSPSRAKMLYV